MLDKTEALLATHDGPFMAGTEFSAADIAWAPFLERYAAQLPCLHRGLSPREDEARPRLASWYEAMGSVAPYSCRVQGDRDSWRRVLVMAGYGNSGSPPELVSEEAKPTPSEAPLIVWREYAASRPYVAPTPGEEAAARLVRNRRAVAADAKRRRALGTDVADEAIDEAIRSFAASLCGDEAIALSGEATAFAKFIERRMCVPRDMAAPAAAVLRAAVRRQS